MVIVVDLTTLAVLLRSYSAFTGVSLFSLMTFGESLFGIVIYYTRLETPIGAIARLKAFNETVTSKDREDPREDIVLDERWPQQELVELCGVSSRYLSARYLRATLVSPRAKSRPSSPPKYQSYNPAWRKARHLWSYR